MRENLKHIAHFSKGNRWLIEPNASRILNFQCAKINPAWFSIFLENKCVDLYSHVNMSLHCHRVGGSMPVIFAYYTEFQPKDRRGSMISLLATFWMSGNIIAAGTSFIIILRSETLVIIEVVVKPFSKNIKA